MDDNVLSPPEPTDVRARRTPIQQPGKPPSVAGSPKGKTAPIVHTALAAILIVSVIAAAYAAGAPSIGIAEFAPQAQSGIDPPPTTGGDNNSGAGGRGGRRTTTTRPSAATTLADSSDPSSSGPPTSIVGRGRRCYGDPPRQAEDPSSPPCIATMFEGDNGGRTWAGVTDTEIRFAAPVGDFFFKNHVKLAVDYFNENYEFYGRKLVPVMFNFPGGTPAQQRAAASDIAAANVFGSIDGFFAPHSSFHAQMARDKIVTVSIGYDAWLDDKFTYDALHPYLWGVYPSTEQLGRNLSDFICSSLAGKPARHAAPSLRSTTRKFGIIAQDSARIPLTDPLVAGIEKCTGEKPELAKIDTSIAGSSDARRAAFERMMSKGVTSMICFCAKRSVWGPVTQAYNMGFGAEWLQPLNSYGNGDEESALQGFTRSYPGLRERIFGMTQTPKILPYAAQPWFSMFQRLQNPNGSQTTCGSTDCDPRVMESVYRPMLVLAAGIQMAGPNLTPDTFAAGLMNTQFPNTGAGAEPFFQPTVGFGPGDHTFFNDYALTWHSDQADAYNWGWSSAKGSWCYIGGGSRYSIGTWPKDADSRFFSESERCR